MGNQLEHGDLTSVTVSYFSSAGLAYVILDDDNDNDDN